MSITEDSRPTHLLAASKAESSAGSGSPSGQRHRDIQSRFATEDRNSPQANYPTASIPTSPAGNTTGRSQAAPDTQRARAAANNLPGGHHPVATRSVSAAGEQAPVPATDDPEPMAGPPVRDQAPPVARDATGPKAAPLLADPLLALAADVLDDLEKVRIANENRLRQLTRSTEDSDGEVRGFGLDEAHPDVARLAALVGMLAEAEHKATLNLQRRMRYHALGPWAKAQKGLGEKQVARLLAAIGDPYIRPEITREDGAVEPTRPRTVSELWAYAGYHVVPAGHCTGDPHGGSVSGEQNGSDPGQGKTDAHMAFAGVAPKKARGQRANWSATAKMRTFLIAESCIKNRESPYRSAYDATRQKYAGAVHAAECIRCGPKGKPAPVGSPLSDGHKHARALRAVAKEILKDLWREARRIHEETSVSGHGAIGTHMGAATDGTDLPSANGATTSIHEPPTASSTRPEGAAEDSVAA